MLNISTGSISIHISGRESRVKAKEIPAFEGNYCGNAVEKKDKAQL